LQSSNGSNSISDRQALQEEFSALNDELNRIAETTSFAGRKLLNGQFGTGSFQVGAGSGEAIQVSLKSMRSDQLAMGGVVYQTERGAGDAWRVNADNKDFNVTYIDGSGEEQAVSFHLKLGDDIEQVATYINGQSDEISASVNEHGQLQIFAGATDAISELSFSGSFSDELGLQTEGRINVNALSIENVGGAQLSVSVIDEALKYVDSHRAELGAYQNRLGHTINNLSNMEENLSVSKGRIQDADYAKEITQMIKQQILQQVSTSILAQAKQTPNLALTLLKS
jgi:flagellin